MVGVDGCATVVVVMVVGVRLDVDDEAAGGGAGWKGDDGRSRVSGMLWHTIADIVCVLMDGVDVVIALMWWVGDWFDHLGGAITSDA